MNSLVLYDSLYGNTETIAKTIGKELSAQVINIKDVSPQDLAHLTLLIIGSPVHGGRATPMVDLFIKNIPDNSLKGVKVSAFDTRFAVNEHGIGVRILLSIIRYAAPRMAEDLKRKGGKLIVPPLGFIVEEKAGPLKYGELEKAKKWAKKLKEEL